VTRYLIISLFLLISFDTEAQWKQGPNDTLFVPIIIDQGDTMTFGVMDMVLVWGRMNAEQRRAHREWTRLRNAVYVTYPYAKKAGAIINDVNMHLQGVTDASKRKKYLSQREKELKKEFTEPLTNLSVYQGSSWSRNTEVDSRHSSGRPSPGSLAEVSNRIMNPGGPMQKWNALFRK
jgi:hypothetical protein